MPHLYLIEKLWVKLCCCLFIQWVGSNLCIVELALFIVLLTCVVDQLIYVIGLTLHFVGLTLGIVGLSSHVVGWTHRAVRCWRRPRRRRPRTAARATPAAPARAPRPRRAAADLRPGGAGQPHLALDLHSHPLATIIYHFHIKISRLLNAMEPQSMYPTLA